MAEKEIYAPTLIEFAGTDPTEHSHEDEDGETIVRGVDHLTTEPESVDAEQLHAEVVAYLTEEAKQLAL